MYVCILPMCFPIPNGYYSILGYDLSWPELYMYTVYGRMYSNSLAKNTVRTPYVAVCTVISLQKIPYVHRICASMFGPTLVMTHVCMYPIHVRSATVLPTTLLS